MSLSLRAIDAGIGADRARLRATAMVELTTWLQAGIEVNPLADEASERIGPLVNVRALEETAARPALILGTSSDRIGTEEGQVYYATLSKDLEAWTGLPVAPYAGASWSDEDEEWREIGGLTIRWDPRVRTTHLWDGVNLHHVVTAPLEGGRSLGLVIAERDDGEHFLGITFGATFPAPWAD